MLLLRKYPPHDYKISSIFIHFFLRYFCTKHRPLHKTWSFDNFLIFKFGIVQQMDFDASKNYLSISKNYLSSIQKKLKKKVFSCDRSFLRPDYVGKPLFFFNFFVLERSFFLTSKNHKWSAAFTAKMSQREEKGRFTFGKCPVFVLITWQEN